MLIINIPFELYALWLFRIGVVFLLLGVLMPKKYKKTILSKVINRKQRVATDERFNKLYSFIDGITENSFFKPFLLYPNSKKYQRLESLINKTAISGLNPNVVQFLKIVLSLMVFVVSSLYVILDFTVYSLLHVYRRIQDEVFRIQPQEYQQNANIIFWVILLSALFYFLPEFYLKSKAAAQRAKMQKELPTIGTFVVIMLESGTHTVYDILKTLLDTTSFFKPYILVCLNEYHINPKRAIQNMAERVDDEEFQIICNGLKQAVETDKGYAATFMKQHLEQLEKIHDLQRESNIKKKPLVYVFLLAFPLISIVAIWFYPWFVRALRLLGAGF